MSKLFLLFLSLFFWFLLSGGIIRLSEVFEWDINLEGAILIAGVAVLIINSTSARAEQFSKPD